MNKNKGEEKIVDVFNTLNDDQKTVVYYLIDEAIKEIKNEYERKLRLYLFSTDCIYKEIFENMEEEK